MLAKDNKRYRIYFYLNKFVLLNTTVIRNSKMAKRKKYSFKAKIKILIYSYIYKTNQQ